MTEHGWELERIDPKNNGHGAHTEDDVNTALLALALNGGQVTQATKDLAAGGLKIPVTTLHSWREKYPNRYRSFLADHKTRVESRAASNYLEIQHKAQAVAMQALDKAADELRKGNVRDPASVARNAMVSAGVANTHMMNLEGRPAIITEHRRPEDVAARLRELGFRLDGFDTESTAVESPPSELPSEASPSD